MTNQTKAIQQALNTLEFCREIIADRELEWDPACAQKWNLMQPVERIDASITSLREALAQPAQQINAELLAALELCESNISSLLASGHPRAIGNSPEVVDWLEVVRSAIAKTKGTQ